jgi:hypothetical protein
MNITDIGLFSSSTQYIEEKQLAECPIYYTGSYMPPAISFIPYEYSKAVYFMDRQEDRDLNFMLRYGDYIEEWKDVTFENVKKDMYEVSSMGKVRNKKTGKMMSQHANYGYCNTGLRRDDNGTKVYRVHRLVANEFCELKKDKNITNHKDSIRDNNYFKNLEWVDHNENMKHMTNFGNHRKGEDSPQAVFTNEQVHEICRMLETGEYSYPQILKAIGKDHTVENNHTLIGNIRRKINWLHISNQYNMPPIFIHNVRDPETIHKICQMMEDGITHKEIAIQVFGTAENDKKELTKNYKILYKIKHKTRYTEISKQYNF